MKCLENSTQYTVYNLSRYDILLLSGGKQIIAFRTNDSQQYSLTDTTYGLTTRKQKALENSWAKVFAEEIFPAIDEERFRVLYSDRTQSRFNTPVNICVRVLIIKEMSQISDDEVVENLMLDPRCQLHTTSYVRRLGIPSELLFGISQGCNLKDPRSHFNRR